MRKLYSLFLIILASAVCSGAQAQDGQNTCLTLNFANNEIVRFELPDNPVVTFGDTDFTVSTDAGVKVSYPRTNLENFTFTKGDNTITGISDVTADAGYTVEFIDGDTFVVRGTKVSEVKVFNVAGQCLCDVKATEGEALVSLSGLPAGVYVVEIPGLRSMKIMK